MTSRWTLTTPIDATLYFPMAKIIKNPKFDRDPRHDCIDPWRTDIITQDTNERNIRSSLSLLDLSRIIRGIGGSNRIQRKCSGRSLDDFPGSWQRDEETMSLWAQLQVTLLRGPWRDERALVPQETMKEKRTVNVVAIWKNICVCGPSSPERQWHVRWREHAFMKTSLNLLFCDTFFGRTLHFFPECLFEVFCFCESGLRGKKLPDRLRTGQNIQPELPRFSILPDTSSGFSDTGIHWRLILHWFIDCLSQSIILPQAESAPISHNSCRSTVKQRYEHSRSFQTLQHAWKMLAPVELGKYSLWLIGNGKTAKEVMTWNVPAEAWGKLVAPLLRMKTTFSLSKANRRPFFAPEFLSTH